MNTNESMYRYMSNYLSKSDIYASKIISKVSVLIFKKRKELKMSQKEFAKKMGVTQGMVSKWESADYNFTVETIAQICEKLNVTFDIDFSSENEYFVENQANKYENAKGSFSQTNSKYIVA